MASPNPTHLMDLSAHELARLIRERQVAPTQAVEACLERVHQLNPALTAFVALDEANARKIAAEMTERQRNGEDLGPLGGVPLGVKDLEDVAGLPTTHGGAIWKDYIPTRDSVHVARLKKAGCIVIGKTAAPTLGFTGWTFSKSFGITRNPWNLERTPGGSSGGTSAAIAARILPLSTASDGGGSIRGPSCYVGAFGFKPTYGRIPLTGKSPWPGHKHLIDFAHLGPITRNVLDAAIYIDACAGYHPDDFQSLPKPTISYEAVVRNPPTKRLKIAFSRTLGIVPGVQPEVMKGVENAVETLRSLGHTVVELDDAVIPKPGIGWTYGAGGNTWISVGQEIAGKESELDESFVQGVEAAGSITIKDIAVTLRRISEINEALNKHFFNPREDDPQAGYDVLVSPGMPWEAPAALPSLPDEVGGAKLTMGPGGNVLDFWGYSMPFNFCGNPACILRTGLSDAGLPTSVQFVGRKHEDEVLFALAAEYEKETGCFDKWPEVKV